MVKRPRLNTIIRAGRAFCMVEWAVMIDSMRNNRRGILLMIVSALLASFGQMFWKMSHTDGFLLVVPGFALYALGALVMIVAYRYGNLSVLQPILCLSYIFAIFIAAFILQEQITPLKLAGILVIILGVVLIAGGDSAGAPESGDRKEGPS